MISQNIIDGGNKGYYVEPYFFHNPHSPGYWCGTGSAMLGLGQMVLPHQFERILHGFTPEGIPLIKNAGPDQKWFAVDFTLGVPKDLSVVLAHKLREHREEIAKLVVEAMQPGFALLEQVAEVRFGKGGSERVPAKPIIAVFPQFENRHGEIHIHAHAVCMKAALTEDGRSGAIDQRSLYTPQLKMAMGAVDRAELAVKAEKQFGIVPIRKGFSFAVKGVPEHVTAEASTRRKQVEAELLRTGHKGPKAAAYATLATRVAKDTTPLPGLISRWENYFVERGFGPEAAQSCLNQSPRHGLPKEIAQKRAVNGGLFRATELKSYFNQLDLTRYVAEEALCRGVSGRAVLDLVEQSLVHHPEIIRLGYQNDRAIYTSAEVKELEKEFISEATRAQKDDSHALPRAVVERALKHAELLSDEQKNVVRYGTTHPAGVAVIGGWAGTGKTTTLAKIRELYVAAGYQVVGATHTGKAAVVLTTQAKIPARTIASTLIQIRKDAIRRQTGEQLYLRIHKKTILVIDEASTAGTRDLVELQREFRKNGAKILFVGDARQTQSIEFGGAMTSLARRLGQVELSEIRRQKDAWARQAVKQFGSGDSTGALAAFADRDLVHVSKTRFEALEEMTRDWSDKGLRDPRGNLMIAATNSEVRRANEIAQEMRRQQGLLSTTQMDVGEQSFHIGDRLLFLRNDHKLDVRNGQLGTIVAMRPFEGLIAVDIDQGRRVLVPLSDYKHISLGYATTIHKSQGITAPRTFCLLPEDAYRELAVVQASRHSDYCKFYVDEMTAGPKLGAIAKAMSKSRQQVFATDVARRDPSYIVLRPEFQR